MRSVRFLPLIFCFKKPEIIHLSYINVLVKNKPVLFIAWQVKHARLIKLLPLKRRYFGLNNAIILALPIERTEVKLTIVNFWRQTAIKLDLNTVEMDQTTTAQLIHGFHPLNKMEVHAPLIFWIKNNLEIKLFPLEQKSNPIKVTARFNINIQHFNYP
jgi:hypothetical protein